MNSDIIRTHNLINVPALLIAAGNVTTTCKEVMMSKSITLSQEDIEAFWKQVSIQGVNECWIWRGGHSGKYGWFCNKGKRILAHRASWIISNGSDPGELFVCHTCDNPECVNPSHLFLGTNYDNVQDMCRKGRHGFRVQKGEDCVTHKLTEKDVLEIREKYSPRKYSTRALAKEYRVSQTQIRNVLDKTSWRHL
jgi:hypothetical protein